MEINDLSLSGVNLQTEGAGGAGIQGNGSHVRGTGFPPEMGPTWLKVRMPIKSLVSQFAPSLHQLQYSEAAGT